MERLRRATGSYLTTPLVRFLARLRISPNAVTWFGFALSVGAAALATTEQLLAAGFVTLIAGFFDMLDGALARNTDRVTRFGAVLDSTLDRLSEAVVLLGIAVFYVKGGFFVGLLLVGIALPASFLVSYIRARAEAMGLECKVGIFTRTERVVVLALGLLLSRIDYAFLTAALGIIALFSVITVCQRLLQVWQLTKD